jgi:hypothetical protein
MKTVLAGAAALALVVAIFVIGWSNDDGDKAAQTTTQAAATTEPASTGPTSEVVKNAVFERAYSECSSFGRPELAGKYKLANQKDATIATGVARGWVEYFKAGEDAVPDGRAGCLQALSEDS